jgi:hypothetical protein
VLKAAAIAIWYPPVISYLARSCREPSVKLDQTTGRDHRSRGGDGIRHAPAVHFPPPTQKAGGNLFTAQFRHKIAVALRIQAVAPPDVRAGRLADDFNVKRKFRA